MTSECGTLVTRLAIRGEGTYVVDTATGLVTFAPDASYTGSSTVTLSVADASANRTTARLTVKVTR